MGPFAPMTRKRNGRKGTGLPQHIREHGAGFRAVLTTNGKRIRSRTFATVGDAEEWLALVLPDRDAIAKRPTSMTLAECLDVLRVELREIAAEPGTLAFYNDHSRTLMAGLGGEDARIDMVSQQQVQGYVNARRQKGIKGTTIVGKELMILRRFLKIARAAGVSLPIDCMKDIRTPKVQTTRFGYLMVAEIAEIAAAMRADSDESGYWADIVELLFQTGLRRTELVRLRADRDIDLRRQHIAVQGKMRDRLQPFGKALVPVLERLKAGAFDDGRIVESKTKVASVFTKWRRRLKLDHFSPHVLRHSYATALAPKVSPWVLMRMLDHGSLKQTETYYHSTDAGMRGALDGLAQDLHARPTEPSKHQQAPE